MNNEQTVDQTVLPQLLTSKEVATLLRMTDVNLRTLRANGEGPAFIKLPTGGIRYTAAAVNAWISDPG